MIYFWETLQWPLTAISRLILTFFRPHVLAQNTNYNEVLVLFFVFIHFYWLQKYVYFILNISEVKNQSEFYTGLSPWSLPCKESFLSSVAFNCVYDARVACQSRRWLFYTPRSKYHVGFSGERMTIYRRYKKIESSSYLEIYRSDEANGNTNKISMQIPLF